jgi:hypothetical protein
LNTGTSFFPEILLQAKFVAIVKAELSPVPGVILPFLTGINDFRDRRKISLQRKNQVYEEIVGVVARQYDLFVWQITRPA